MPLNPEPWRIRIRPTLRNMRPRCPVCEYPTANPAHAHYAPACQHHDDAAHWRMWCWHCESEHQICGDQLVFFACGHCRAPLIAYNPALHRRLTKRIRRRGTPFNAPEWHHPGGHRTILNGWGFPADN